LLEETQSLEVVGRLVVEGTSHLVHLGTNKIGRDLASAIVLPQLAVSSLHAVVVASAAAAIIYDAGSANGTKKNGMKLVPLVKHALDPDDFLVLGNVYAVWRAGPPEEPEPAELSVILPPRRGAPAWFNPNIRSSPLRGHVPESAASCLDASTFLAAGILEEATQSVDSLLGAFSQAVAGARGGANRLVAEDKDPMAGTVLSALEVLRSGTEPEAEAREAVRRRENTRVRRGIMEVGPEGVEALVTPPRGRKVSLGLVVSATPCTQGLLSSSPGEEEAFLDSQTTTDREAGEGERATATRESAMVGIEQIPAPQDRKILVEESVGASGSVMEKVQEVIPIKVVRRASYKPRSKEAGRGAVAEVRAVARVRLMRLRGLTVGSVVQVAGGYEDEAPPAKAPRHPAEAARTTRLPTTAGSKAKRYKCHEQGCGYLSPRERDLANHGRAQHGHTKLVCEEPDCDREFGSSYGLNQHNRAVHQGLLFKCGKPGCDYTAVRKRDLANHGRARHGHAKLACTVPGCTKEFALTLSLGRHKKKHVA